MSDDLSLQDRLAPQSVCFGCGPANESGLHIKSFVRGDEVVCDYEPLPHQNAFPGVLCGGIVGTLLDYGTSVSEASLDVESLGGLGPTAPNNLHHFVGYAAIGYR